MDSELFWCLVGDKIQSWFLYNSILTKKQFKELCFDVRKENKGDDKE